MKPTLPQELEDAEPITVVDPQEAAELAGLRYVSDAKPGITRERAGEDWRYVGPRGKEIADERTLVRIRSLAIPPAYTDVWICPHADGHIQATGRDAKGRKQYRYHLKFREFRESTKYEHMFDFAAALPRIRAAVAEHMSLRGLPREKVLATVVHLLEHTMIRIGNDDYAKQNDHYGLTTLQDEHVDVTGGQVHFHFTGKSGKEWKLDFRDRRVAKIVKACQDLPGQELFQYRDADGAVHDVTSSDVNAYLKEISGREITAKDFRTWTGTVLAAHALAEFEEVDSQAAAKKNIRQAIERVSARLGNTPAICRKCYVHPEVFESYLAKELVLEVREEVEEELGGDLSKLRPEEVAVLALLRTRLAEQAHAPAAG